MALPKTGSQVTSNEPDEINRVLKELNARIDSVYTSWFGTPQIISLMHNTPKLIPNPLASKSTNVGAWVYGTDTPSVVLPGLLIGLRNPLTNVTAATGSLWVMAFYPAAGATTSKVTFFIVPLP